MRFFLALITFFSLNQAYAADTCSDLSGTYRIDEVATIRLTQHKCFSLKIEFGQIDNNGRINWHKGTVKSYLNGTPLCDTFACRTGSISENYIQISRDNPGLAYDPIHGDCSFKTESYLKNTNGVITRSQDVYQCSDGYAGHSLNMLIPLKE